MKSLLKRTDGKPCVWREINAIAADSELFAAYGQTIKTGSGIRLVMQPETG